MIVFSSKSSDINHEKLMETRRKTMFLLLGHDCFICFPFWSLQSISKKSDGIGGFHILASHDPEYHALQLPSQVGCVFFALWNSFLVKEL